MCLKEMIHSPSLILHVNLTIAEAEDKEECLCSFSPGKSFGVQVNEQGSPLSEVTPTTEMWLTFAM